jgi:hypothetical protein
VTEGVSVTLREEHRLRVFENRVLRRILGPKGRKWGETGEDCIMRGFITCTLHQILLVIISRRVRWAEHVARMGEMRNAYGKPERRRPLERPTYP